MSTTSFMSGGKKIDAELFTPTGATTTSLVVIAYGTDGLTDDLTGPWKKMIRDYGQELASRGMMALIPDYFARTGTSPGKHAMEVMAFSLDDWAAALHDAVTHAKTLPHVDGARIGLLGFSLGGHLCLRTRAATKPKALVSFFAPEFGAIGPAAVPPVPAAELHHGKADALPATQFSNAVSIKNTLTAEGTRTTLHAYDGAGHGFIGSDDSNKDARTLSKTRTLAFFSANL